MGEATTLLVVLGGAVTLIAWLYIRGAAKR